MSNIDKTQSSLDKTAGLTDDELILDYHATDPDQFENPGLPPHQDRVTDTEPAAAKRAERQVASLFVMSALGTIGVIASYLLIRPEPANFGDIRISTTFLGISMALSLLGIGLGAVHWAKTLMADHEVIEARHPQRGTDEERAAALEKLSAGLADSAIGRRPLIRNTLLGAMALFPLPAIFLLGDLGPLPGNKLKTTMWKSGTRLARDPQGTPIKASDVTLGAVFHVIPEGLRGSKHYLEKKSKAAVLLVRIGEGVIKDPDPRRAGWDVDGIFAYSKICTHVGCPVALYEQQTHHLLCPCHQSTFDVAQYCEVVFGPAKRPLPQLPIGVDDEGYLVAKGDFDAPPGPSFWDIEKPVDESGSKSEEDH